jgi:hypothetical protein
MPRLTSQAQDKWRLAVWLRLRAWWYLRLRSKAQLPMDVREYLLRSGLKDFRKAKNPSPKTQSDIAENLLLAAMTVENGGISDELRGELLQEGMSRLAQIPSDNCFKCQRPIFIHQAFKIDEKFHCEGCFNFHHSKDHQDATR